MEESPESSKPELSPGDHQGSSNRPGEIPPPARRAERTARQNRLAARRPHPSLTPPYTLRPGHWLEVLVRRQDGEIVMQGSGRRCCHLRRLQGWGCGFEKVGVEPTEIEFVVEA